jgi:hypothetical protein
MVLGIENSIFGALASRELKRISEIIWRRFAGEHLDVPIDKSRGEMPRAIVVTAFAELLISDQSKAELLAGTITHLLTERVIPSIEGHFANDEFDELPAILETFSFIEDLRPRGIQDTLVEIGARVLALVGQSGPLELLVLGFFRCAAKYLDDTRIAKMCSTALATPSASVELAVAFGAAAPDLFLKALVPDFLFALRDSPEFHHAQLSKIRECIRIPFQQIVDTDDKDHSHVRGAVAQLSLPIAGLAHYRAGADIHRAVVEGLALANVPAATIRRFENTYWREHPRRDGLTDPHLRGQRTALRERVVEWTRSRHRHKVSPLRINSIPYAEGALLHVSQIALKLSSDVDVHVEPLPYGQVRLALIKGEIDIAVHNDSFYEQRWADPQQEIKLLESPPLVKFKDYELLGSIPRLRKIVLDEELDESAQRLASELLGEGEFHVSNGNAEALNRLVELGRITCLRQSDTHDAAKTAFEKMGVTLSDSNIVDLGPDEGLEHVLDGDILFYVGGALQSHYGTTVCPTRVKKILRINDNTDVRYFVRQDTFERNTNLYESVLNSWRAVRAIWDTFSEPDHYQPEEFRTLLASLRDDVLVSTNRDRGVYIGLSPSFHELQHIIRIHDDILSIPDGATFAPEDTRTKAERRNAPPMKIAVSNP